MSDSQLRPADFNCEILPCETHPDFDDSTRFKKVEFPEQAGLAANSLLQLIPAQAAAGTCKVGSNLPTDGSLCVRKCIRAGLLPAIRQHAFRHCCTRQQEAGSQNRSNPSFHVGKPPVIRFALSIPK